MESNPTMPPSILQYDETTEQYRLCLQQGPWAGRVFMADLDICCQPTCDCGEIDFTCIEPGQPELKFTLDTAAQQILIYPDDAMSTEARSLAEAVVAELQESDWKELFGLVFLTKLDAIDQVDPATLDLESPVKVEMGDGRLVAFADIFPYGHLSSVESGRSSWLVEDLYCVDPGCKCHEVVLIFIPEGADPTDESKFPTVIYDYKRRKLGRVLIGLPAGQGTFKDLVAKLREQHPAFELKVENRHLKLRVLYLRSLQESGGVPDAEDAGNVLAKPDVGRNDPCPCGSGKKYKKCCWVPDVAG